SVSTLAAAGSAISWAKEQFFPALSWDQYNQLLKKLAKPPRQRHRQDILAPQVRFEPYLAGERTSVEQKQASFSGLTLSTTREDMLRALINAIAAASAERFEHLSINPVKIRREVF